MKCIKKHGEIRRVWERDAKKLVEESGWAYCPKSEWKMKTRKNGQSENTTQTD